MCDLVARTGRLQQRYEAGFRLVAGCIPFKYKHSDESSDATSEKVVEVLMINSPSGPGLLFPKGGWENDETVEEAAVREAIEEAGVRGVLMDCLGYYHFKSKTLQDEFSPEGLCKAAMFALLVEEELNSWPEQSTRERRWLSIPEAAEHCRYPWMRDALEDGFSNWYSKKMMMSSGEEGQPTSDPSSLE
ncbi:NUDIX hydrolase domain [Macleaya cordata]|uniref:NUDIX hydrolase domain n=1 Tax=Macleaya cordata TaxID=56857 RepID=A0A200R722_MACCD|nr:NUDIX hydrolase domain [Macleaya cordata]